MLKLSLDRLNDLFAAVAADQVLYIPADDASGQARFQRWHDGLEMTGALNTVRSAKDFFFPQTENLVDFKLKGKEIEIIIAPSTRTLSSSACAPATPAALPFSTKSFWSTRSTVITSPAASTVPW